MSERKTLQEAMIELHEAWNELVLAVADRLGVIWIATKLEALLTSIDRRFFK